MVPKKFEGLCIYENIIPNPLCRIVMSKHDFWQISWWHFRRKEAGNIHCCHVLVRTSSQNQRFNQSSQFQLFDLLHQWFFISWIHRVSQWHVNDVLVLFTCLFVWLWSGGHRMAWLLTSPAISNIRGCLWSADSVGIASQSSCFRLYQPLGQW